MSSWRNTSKALEEEIDKEHREVVLANGRYTNPWKTWLDLTFWDGVMWTSRWRPPPPPAKEEIAQILHPIRSLPTNPSDQMKATWLGHATVLLQCNGLNILTDPVWTSQLVDFGNSFLRVTSAPLPLENLPTIHVCLISHSHSDHFDLETANLLEYVHRPIWCVPSSFRKRLFKRDPNLKSAVIDDRCVEFSWWQERTIVPNKLEVVGLPAQHWSNRGLLDMNVTLWNSFALRFTQCGKTVYFAGDTGYCSAFQCIGKVYGPFDLALLPIGAYAPRYMLEKQHVDPEQAVHIHRDVRAKKSLAIHWGTWILANEPLLEPPQKLAEALNKRKLSNDEFISLKQGESLQIK